ncbi:unnamed protein product [Aspergillus oryzae]|uniref:nitrilase n=2 Tax=Aspergillus oryzae TaxID=5062 RepID=A0AAN4YVL9_ASPOZ|nr:unnamed protein product [Aspergillus oryzae]
MTSKVKVAAVQAEPVWNDLQGGVSKVISLIKDAAKNGAKVVGFPEIIQSFIDPTGTIVHHRRKIKPTHVERSYWGDGQADSLKTVAPSAFGNIGGLNCWEHTQPLLRYYEYAQNVDIHVASWPCLWNVPSWTYHASDEASSRFSQVMAMEGACFVLVCTQIQTPEGKVRSKLPDFD